jgi:hypothetical protein
MFLALAFLWSLSLDAHGATLAPERRDAAIAAYRGLTGAEIEAHPIKALPSGLETVRVDVSARFRSASFGHSTTLLVPPTGREFYVEYGRSTNKPGGLFGPFTLP